MKKKQIIGFVGQPGVGKTFAAKIFAKHGFHLVSVNDKVLEFAKCLFPVAIEHDKQNIIDAIRQKGCAVHKTYWLNLVLTSISDEHDYIVFDDLLPEETVSKAIKAYQIYRPDISTEKFDEIEVVNNENIDDFARAIEKLAIDIKKS